MFGRKTICMSRGRFKRFLSFFLIQLGLSKIFSLFDFFNCCHVHCHDNISNNDDDDSNEDNDNDNDDCVTCRTTPYTRDATSCAPSPSPPAATATKSIKDQFRCQSVIHDLFVGSTECYFLNLTFDQTALLLTN